MKITDKGILKITVFALIILTLFTPAQAYYSAYVHLGLLGLCFLVAGKAQREVFFFVFGGVFLCGIFVLMTIAKELGTVMTIIGFFLHYLTWPTVFLCVTRAYSYKEMKRLLLIIVGLCIIGDVLSLIQLNINPDIARLLAGVSLEEEKIMFYKKGVGGYGYVFAMAFLTFGIVRWLRTTDKLWERAYLIVFLVINSLFVLYAAYTTAIMITILMAGVALMSGAKNKYRLLIVMIALLIVVCFRMPIIEFCYNVANDLEIEWVAKRFGQLLYAQKEDDLSSLRRFELYKLSWNTFLRHPLFGGGIYGGHSQVLDVLAGYGVFGFALIWLFNNCKKLCEKVLVQSNLTIFFFTFFAFACIDTCSVMQLPVAVFFVVPLIAYMEIKGEKM